MVSRLGWDRPPGHRLALDENAGKQPMNTQHGNSNLKSSSGTQWEFKCSSWSMSQRGSFRGEAIFTSPTLQYKQRPPEAISAVPPLAT